MVGHCAQASTYVHFETELFPSRGFIHARFRDKTKIVETGQATGMLGASAECRLEFAAETLAVRMAEQKTRQRARIRRNVKTFVGANSGVWTGGDVADRISASLAGGNVDGREPSHHARGIIDVDVMKLEILAGGDVGDAVRIFL